MSKNIKIEVKGVEESAMEVVGAWERAEQGLAPEEPIERLYFQSLETLLSVLTTRRLEPPEDVACVGALQRAVLGKKTEQGLQERSPGYRPFGEGWVDSTKGREGKRSLGTYHRRNTPCRLKGALREYSPFSVSQEGDEICIEMHACQMIIVRYMDR